MEAIDARVTVASQSQPSLSFNLSNTRKVCPCVRSEPLVPTRRVSHGTVAKTSPEPRGSEESRPKALAGAFFLGRTPTQAAERSPPPGSQVTKEIQTSTPSSGGRGTGWETFCNLVIGRETLYNSMRNFIIIFFSDRGKKAERIGWGCRSRKRRDSAHSSPSSFSCSGRKARLMPAEAKEASAQPRATLRGACRLLLQRAGVYLQPLP
ncbi:hypothetical protein H1C71_019458 [Ictidomys tridecemlineatus]|nr:hypothetical protein H1C71_019458 [Ictidomys tridecemlineatus]